MKAKSTGGVAICMNYKTRASIYKVNTTTTITASTAWPRMIYHVTVKVHDCTIRDNTNKHDSYIHFTCIHD